MTTPGKWRAARSHHDGGGRLRAVDTFTGTRVTVLEGDGETDPYREVVSYFDENGVPIATYDPMEGTTGPRGVADA